MEDSSRSYGELVSTSRTLPDFPLLDPIGMFSSAPGASNAIGPTLLTKKDLTLVLGGEPFLEFENIHANHLGNEYNMDGRLCQGDKAFPLLPRLAKGSLRFSYRDATFKATFNMGEMAVYIKGRHPGDSDMGIRPLTTAG